jgi:two-component system CheB/CheR fusion protein
MAADQSVKSVGAVGPDASEHDQADELGVRVPTPGSPRVVGLGGSAGSLVALQSFLKVVPPDSGMAFVIVLHLSPEHESVLAATLQQPSAIPVTSAGDGERVSPNHVYVIPPAKLLSMSDGHLRLTELPLEHGRRQTVDLFFRSLAEAYGPRSVAVVFSGGDGDGAIGIKRIKERGGLTVAQDPDEAEHPGMPRAAVATGMVDWVLRAAEMPLRLVEYDARERRLRIPPEAEPSPSKQWQAADGGDEAALHDVLTFLRTRTGRDFSYYKRATIVRRVARRMQVSEVDTLPAYLGFLRTHPGEADALLQDLLISVTNFFRDKESFEALEAATADLFRGKVQSDVVRVWVPGCATGEEAYSIAMLLAEHARTLDSPPSLQIFATDLNEAVLVEARSGYYPASVANDVSAERLRRFFVKEPDGYRVRRELREMLLFAVHDLLQDSPFSKLDMISCRNLMIYLNRDAQLRVQDIFHFALRPEGRLFLGTSESVDEANQLFYAIDDKHRIYARRGGSRTSPPMPSGQSTLARALALQDRAEPGLSATKPRTARPAVATGPRLLQSRPGLSWAELHLKLLERFGAPSVLVNGEHEILHLSESAAQFLQLAGGEPTHDLLRLVHPQLRAELRAALFRAKRTNRVSAAEHVPVELEGVGRLVCVRVAPAAELAPDFLLVTFELEDGALPMAQGVREQDEPLVRQLERELEETKRYLRGTVEQHEAATEELKANNEELQAMNEELRSATEELETSREELQSINEELTTVNQELKGKVDELAHANSDLRNLMGATAIATIFLDRELRIMRFTPPAVELFSLIPTDVGRPLADLHHRLAYPELLADAARVLQQLVPIEREIAESGGRFFLARILPYRTTEDRIAGVVLTFVDITEGQVAQDAVRKARESLEERVRERTALLDATNTTLRQEVHTHQRVERERQQLQRLLLNAQEEERRRISRELHDEIGQQIPALMLSLRALESEDDPERSAAKLRELRAWIERFGDEIHQVALKLRPAALDDLGLARALSSYVEAWTARTGIAAELVAVGIEEQRLPPLIETTVYRIVQEAMTNVVRHASAKTVSVSVERRGETVLAIVEDDGVGFEPGALVGAGVAHIGLAGMRERATIVGGEFTVASHAGAGTTVRVRLPIPADPGH